MELLDLDPRWWCETENDVFRRGLGVTFLCPLCRRDRIHVAFENPICAGSATTFAKNHWKREGDKFETLSLFPSVDARGCCSDGCPGWYGHVQFGGVL